jgi:hypothetical protein
MFGKAKCKICGDEVRFALKHLRDKHEDVLERDLRTLKMQRIMKKYFD